MRRVLARHATIAVAENCPIATESRIAAWNAAHQTNRREADVRLSVLVARIDCVEIELSNNAERHQLERSFIS